MKKYVVEIVEKVVYKWSILLFHRNVLKIL